jgi:hypothetical protein
MFQILGIVAIVLAFLLPLLDLVVLRPRRRAIGQDGRGIRGAERFIYLLFLLLLRGLSISSILMLAIGTRMLGWMLMVHMILAPLFAICITVLALLWAGANSSGCDRAGEKIVFWLIVLCGFVTISTAMLGMMSWFGSDGQEALLNVHRISAFVLLVCAAWQAGRLLARPVTTPAVG